MNEINILLELNSIRKDVHNLNKAISEDFTNYSGENTITKKLSEIEEILDNIIEFEDFEEAQ